MRDQFSPQSIMVVQEIASTFISNTEKLINSACPRRMQLVSSTSSSKVNHPQILGIVTSLMMDTTAYFGVGRSYGVGFLLYQEAAFIIKAYLMGSDQYFLMGKQTKIKIQIIQLSNCRQLFIKFFPFRQFCSNSLFKTAKIMKKIPLNLENSFKYLYLKQINQGIALLSVYFFIYYYKSLVLLLQSIVFSSFQLEPEKGRLNSTFDDEYQHHLSSGQSGCSMAGNGRVRVLPEKVVRNATLLIHQLRRQHQGKHLANRDRSLQKQQLSWLFLYNNQLSKQIDLFKNQMLSPSAQRATKADNISEKRQMFPKIMSGFLFRFLQKYSAKKSDLIAILSNPYQNHTISVIERRRTTNSNKCYRQIILEISQYRENPSILFMFALYYPKLQCLQIDQFLQISIKDMPRFWIDPEEVSMHSKYYLLGQSSKLKLDIIFVIGFLKPTELKSND